MVAGREVQLNLHGIARRSKRYRLVSGGKHQSTTKAKYRSQKICFCAFGCVLGAKKGDTAKAILK